MDKQKIIIFVVAIVFIVVGIFGIIEANRLNSVCTEKATGTVVDIIEEMTTDSDGLPDYTYYPVIEYQAESQTISEQSNVGGSYGKYTIGDSVEILYNPNNTSEYIIAGNSTSMIVSIVLTIAGAGLLIYGIYAVIAKK